MENLDDHIWALLADDRFIKWVLSPDEGTTLFWESWMEQDPDRKPMLLKAREIARDLAYTERPVAEQDMAEAIWAGIREDLAWRKNGMAVPNSRSVTPRTINPQTINWRRWPYWAAASVLVLAGAAFLYYHAPDRNPLPEPSQKIATVLLKNDLERSNPTKQNQQVYLVDGSKIILQPGAKIRHAAFLQKDRREVYLEGNAFFEVAKDPARPFYVYTRDLVVRVLGTSFNVSNKENGDITVLVRSGKVSVSQKVGLTQSSLVLEPDQQALYSEETHHLVQMFTVKTAGNPAAGEIPTAAAIPFHFEEAPVTEIFTTLEDAYGIPLHYDKKNFSGCMVTTSLGDETFEEKLKIICEAIGAAYKLDSNGVSLTGRPCKDPAGQEGN